MDKLEDVVELLGVCVKGLTSAQRSSVLDAIEQVTWYIQVAEEKGLAFANMRRQFNKLR